jgi:hypothetical protein
MAEYSQTFLCTAVPAGVTGTKLRIAVLVSPRVASDDRARGELRHWPDVQDWPAIAPSWEVKVSQGGTEVVRTGAEVHEPQAGGYDLAAWRALFPADQMTTPYVPEDRSGQPIASYPVATVRDAIRDLHVTTMATSRTDHPTLDVLQGHEVFRALKQAVDPEPGLVHTAPLPDHEIGLETAFAYAELGFGARPGSQGAKPAGISVHPGTGPAGGGTLVTITGTGLLTATEVRFGGALATDLQVTSASSLTCRTPAGTQDATVAVTVTNAIGTSTPSSNDPADHFRFHTDAPTLTNRDPTTVEGLPSSVELTGTNLLGVTEVRFHDQRAAAGTYSSGGIFGARSDTTLLVHTPDLQPSPDPDGDGPRSAPAVPVDVWVLGPGGQSNQVTFLFYGTPLR